MKTPFLRAITYFRRVALGLMLGIDEREGATIVAEIRAPLHETISRSFAGRRRRYGPIGADAHPYQRLERMDH